MSKVKEYLLEIDKIESSLLSEVFNEHPAILNFAIYKGSSYAYLGYVNGSYLPDNVYLENYTQEDMDWWGQRECNQAWLVEHNLKFSDVENLHLVIKRLNKSKLIESNQIYKREA